MTRPTPLRKTFEQALTAHKGDGTLISDCIDFVKGKALHSSTPYEIHCLKISYNSIDELGEFTLWFFHLMPQTERQRLLRKLFDFLPSAATSYPDPSLALTSALGNIFLPFLPAESQSGRIEEKEMQSSLRLNLFYSCVLDNDDLEILKTLEKSGPEFMSEFIIFLLLHSAFVKDILSMPSVEEEWNEAGVSESQFMAFQTYCLELLGDVQALQ